LQIFAGTNVIYWREEEEEGQKAAAKQNVPKPIER
jgi:hypothetical protein